MIFVGKFTKEKTTKGKNHTILETSTPSEEREREERTSMIYMCQREENE